MKISVRKKDEVWNVKNNSGVYLGYIFVFSPDGRLGFTPDDAWIDYDTVIEILIAMRRIRIAKGDDK